jgi:preprotein translocase subunit YajC
VLAITAFLAASSSGSGSSITFLLPLLLIGGLYFLMIRPQQKRQQQQRQLGDHLEPGDFIVTHGGMYGTVVEIDDGEGTIMLEVAPKVEIQMAKAAVARRLVDEDEVDDDDDSHAAADDDRTQALGDGAKPSADKEAGDQR